MPVNNVSILDMSVASNNASVVSGSILKSNKDYLESLEEKSTKEKPFRDILKGKFATTFPISVEHTQRRELSEEEYLAELQDAVYETGDALSDTISTENIVAYKKAVKTFVEYIVSRAYEVENIVTGGLNPARKKAWTIVRVINKRLDSLIYDLMYNQLKKIEVLKRIDEIKGLIVDLKG